MKGVYVIVHTSPANRGQSFGILEVLAEQPRIVWCGMNHALWLWAITQDVKGFSEGFALW